MTAPAKSTTGKSTTPAKKTGERAARNVEGKKAYTATGRGGTVNVRFYDKVMTHAVDCADPEATREAARKGLIFEFFPSKEKAEAFADRWAEKGYDTQVVAAKPKTDSK